MSETQISRSREMKDPAKDVGAARALFEAIDYGRLAREDKQARRRTCIVCGGACYAITAGEKEGRHLLPLLYGGRESRMNLIERRRARIEQELTDAMDRAQAGGTIHLALAVYRAGLGREVDFVAEINQMPTEALEAIRLEARYLLAELPDLTAGWSVVRSIALAAVHELNQRSRTG